ncbi:hypothetical protein AB0E78_05805 [Streptomyces sp. NPDC032198]|uniref:hypothetical protein n=1 Tax=Streptomyces sp. NPDC032198 TaxID=3155127 RepID=UPI00340EF970
MIPEEGEALPTPTKPLSSDVDPVLSAGISIAVQWGAALGPDRLDVALKALEPQLKRDHQALMKRLEMQREAAERADLAAAEAAARADLDKRNKRKHVQHMSGLIVGAVIAVAMLAGGVYAAADTWWLSAFLCGPSVYALVKVFVLRRSDPDDMRILAKGARGATEAKAQTLPPP